jgi:hypothetical protein
VVVLSALEDSLRKLVRFDGNNFRLKCMFTEGSECKTSWCRHRSDYINRRLDSRAIFDLFFGEDGEMLGQDEIDLLAPIRPTADKWSAVRLKVVSYNILSVIDPNDESVFYGVIGAGQGLRDVRDLWFDSMQQRVEIHGEGTEEGRKLLKCTGAHGWKAKTAEALVVKNKAQVNQYNIEVHLTGKCPTCSRSEGFENYEDMIPEIQNTERKTVWQRQQERANGGQLSRYAVQAGSYMDKDGNTWHYDPNAF